MKNMRVRVRCQVVFLLLFVLIFHGCVNTNVVDSIKDNIEKSINNDNDLALVNLNSLIQQKWDTIYVFKGLISPDEISSITGCPYYGGVVQDKQNRMIITSGREVIVDNNFSQFDNIQFRGNEPGNNPIIYSRNDSILVASQVRTGSGFVIYDVRPLAR